MKFISDKIAFAKKWNTIVSVILFIASMIYTLTKAKLDIFNAPLSKLGITKETTVIWHITLIILAVIILWNSYYQVIASTIKNKILLLVLFAISVLGLIGIVAFDMNQLLLHDLFAGIFFITYSTSIFLYGLYTIKSDLRIGMGSVVVSILMILSATWVAIHMYSIPELVYISLAFIWNAILIWPNNFKNILKFFHF